MPAAFTAIAPNVQATPHQRAASQARAPAIPDEIPVDNFHVRAVSPQNGNEPRLHCTMQSAPARGQQSSTHGVGDAGAVSPTLTAKSFTFRSKRSGYIAAVDNTNPAGRRQRLQLILTMRGRTCRDIPGISQSPHHIFDRICAAVGLIAKVFHGAE